MPQSTRKIALVLKNLAGGGAERVMLHLARGLGAAGDEVMIIVAERKGALVDQVPTGIDLKILGSSRTSRSVIRLARTLNDTRPDAVLSALVHTNTATVIAGKMHRRRSPKIILTEHNQISRNRQERHGALVGLAYRALPWTYPLADHIVAVSAEVAREVQSFSRVSPRKLSVIHNPIVHDGLTDLGAKQPDHTWLMDEHKPVIVAAGSLTKQKGFPDLITAFSFLAPSIPARLVIIGEGPERRELQSQIDRLDLTDRVDLPGFAKNPFAYFANARLFVLSSLWEGFPTVLVEAMYFGTRIVATDCKSGPREILEDGQLGALVPVGSPPELADAMAKSLTRGPAKRAQRIRRAQSFDIATAVDKYQDLIDRIAA